MSYLSYLFLFFIVHFSMCSKEKQSEFNAENEQQTFIMNADYMRDQFVHIFSNYSYRSDPFESENSEVKNSSVLKRTYIFENRNAEEHMFNLVVYCTVKDHSYEYQIIDAKSQSAKKKLMEINWSEFNYQMPVFQILIQNALINHVFWRKYQMIINTIEDVKTSLLKSKKNMQIIMTKDMMNDYNASAFEYLMKIENNTFGSLSIFMLQSEDPTEIGDLNLTGNYSLHLNLNIAKDNQILNGNLSIPMITNDKTKFTKMIQTSIEAIDFKSQFNTFSELWKIVQDYFKSVYPEITFEITQPESSDNVQGSSQYFNLSFENSALEGYLASYSNQSGITEYILMIDNLNNQFSNPVVNVSFLRSSKDVVFSLLSNSGANNIFYSVFNDITQMFNYEFEQIRTQNNTTNQENPIKALELYDNTGNYSGDKSKGLSNGKIKCSYLATNSSDRKKILVKFECPEKELLSQRSFYLDEYDRNSIWDVMNLFFNDYRKNLRLLI